MKPFFTTVGWDPQNPDAPIRPVKVIKESKIAFKNAPAWANYYVRQCDGRVCYYEDEPAVEMQHWYCNTGRQSTTHEKPGYVPSYRQSIRKRPGVK